MATFNITDSSTVESFSKAFKDEFGATLQIYDGRLKAADSVKLVDIGAKTGSFECRASRTVGSFVKMMNDDFNLKVKVRTADDWVTVIDGLTLNRINDLPKQPTKTQMEDFVSYQRKEGVSKGEKDESKNEEDNYEVKTDAQVISLDLPNADGLYSDRAWVNSNRYFGFKREDSDEWVIEPIYEWVNDFSEGLAAVQDEEENYGYINAKGEYVIKPQFDDAWDFKDGVAQVQNKDKKWGCINLKGDWIVKPVFDRTFNWSDDDTSVATVNGKKGVIRRDYSWIIPPLYDDITRVYSNNELYIVEYISKKGILNNKNEWVIKPIYKRLISQDGQVVLAEKEGKTGILNLKEEWLIAPIFDELGRFDEGLAYARIGGKYGYINEKGEWLITPQFDDARSFYDGKAEITYKGCSLKIDKDGLIDGKTAEEYINSNPTFKGWEDTNDLAAKTESVAVPLHKVGDGYDTEVDNHELYEDYYFLLKDCNDNFKVFCGEDWDTIEEFIADNPGYDTIYYCGWDTVISEQAKENYEDDDVWPTVDRTMIEAIKQALEGDNFTDFRYYYPSIDFDLIYNGEVIYSGNISD